MPASAGTDDVLRISTDLVQTDVTVLDSHGRFVDGLKREQFQLRVNGKPKSISFFEQLKAGNENEDLQLAAARGRGDLSLAGQTGITPMDRGRIVFFFLDDFHLSTASFTRAHELLSHFVETEMGQNDEVAIITATQQLGFLEQLSSEKFVLRTALARLSHRRFQTTDAERTPMTEFEALAITRDDRRVLDYFIEQLTKEMFLTRPRGPASAQPAPLNKTRTQVETLVRARARSIVDQAGSLATNTLLSLKGFVRTSAALPGRKILFLISDGFLMGSANDFTDQLHRILDASARAGTVIYSIDARGLISGSPDASSKIAFDNTARLASLKSGAVTAYQEPLRTVAVDSGGRALFNTNAPAHAAKEAINEASDYYLLAWRPEEEDLRGDKFQTIEANVIGRPDLIVLVRRGFFFAQPVAAPAGNNSANARQKREPDDPLIESLRRAFPSRGLPVSLSAGYMDSDAKSAMLTASIEIASKALDFGSGAEQRNPELDIAGIAITAQGKESARFEQSLTVSPPESGSGSGRRVTYNHQLSLSPGLYQVRVAVRERKSGRLGSAMQWIAIPDLKDGSFSLSSIFIGDFDANASLSGKLSLNGDHRFPSRSRLGLFVYMYNAARGQGVPDIALQIQILRDGQPVVTKPLVKVATDGLADFTRIAYGEDISLSALAPGRYVLRLTAIDREAKKSAEQQTQFTVY
ncbi:MAG: VWA domain-containing protein [Pyrinomonadaceae bacterium]